MAMRFYFGLDGVVLWDDSVWPWTCWLAAKTFSGTMISVLMRAFEFSHLLQAKDQLQMPFEVDSFILVLLHELLPV